MVSKAKPRNGGDEPGGQVIVHRSPDGQVQVDVRLEQETVWLTQRQMAALFGRGSDASGLHARNVFKEEELSGAATAEESSVVQAEGAGRVTRRIKFYNLDRDEPSLRQRVAS
jgi:hypothetical protein